MILNGVFIFLFSSLFSNNYFLFAEEVSSNALIQNEDKIEENVVAPAPIVNRTKKVKKNEASTSDSMGSAPSQKTNRTQSVGSISSEINSVNKEPFKEEYQDDNSTTDLFFLCRRDKNIRWLRAYKVDNNKCKAMYSKDGYLQVISSATYFASCEGVLQSVKKNLEEGGFKCSLSPKASVIELELAE